MKRLLTLMLALLAGATLQVQAQKVVSRSVAEQQVRPIPMEYYLQDFNNSSKGINQPSTGGASTEAVTDITIGEGGNAFTYIGYWENQISVVPEVGTNGGTIAFIYRHNDATCGSDNGRYRYSISTDGGANWNVGAGIVNASTPLPPGQCFGKGLLNPTNSFSNRYPNLAIFSDPAATNPTASDLKLVYTGPFHQGGNWQSVIRGAATDIASAGAAVTVTQEDAGNIPESDQFFPTSLVERVPGEFWYLSFGQDVANDTPNDSIKVYKGTWNSTTNSVAWSKVTTLFPNYFTGFDGAVRNTYPRISFSPDGQVGYIGLLSDLVGGSDTVYNPVFIRSGDGGQTWGAPEEIDINGFPEIFDSITQFLVLDTVSAGPPPVIDTLPIFTGKATTAFDFDLTVDANGAPHMIVTVGPASSNFSNDGNTAGYSIFSGGILMNYDVTFDQFGDWNMLYLGSQSTFRTYWGNPASSNTSDYTAQDVNGKIGRSVDGNVIFYSWTDSDTTNPNYSTGVGPGGATTSNTAPNIIGRSYDVNRNKLTSAVNWTLGDPTWDSRAALPKIGHEVLKNGDDYVVPTIIMNLLGTTTIDPTSFVYFSDVTYDSVADYTIDPTFFYNCKQNPVDFTAVPTDAGCGGATDGSITLTENGGVAPYTYLWDNGATTKDITGLAAGIYSVTITDDFGCEQTLSVTVNNVGAASLSIGSVSNISCAGDTDGAATVTATGGTAPYTYSWSNGETTENATMLPAGVNTVKVTDNNGCESFASVTITEPPAINVSTTAQGVLCNGDANGEASVSATGGAGSFTYSWSNGSTAASLTGLAGGNYTVFATDASGCVESALVIITEPPALNVAISTTPNPSPSNPSGSFTASGTGGTSPYTYLWTLPDGTNRNGPFVLGLGGGDTVDLTITDGNGCTLDTTVVMTGEPTSSLEDELSAGFSSVKLFPNPNSGAFTLNIEMQQPEDLRIEILDLAGHVITRRMERNALNLNVEFNDRQLASGLYLLRVSTAKGAATRKLIVR